MMLYGKNDDEMLSPSVYKLLHVAEPPIIALELRLKRATLLSSYAREHFTLGNSRTTRNTYSGEIK